MGPGAGWAEGPDAGGSRLTGAGDNFLPASCKKRKK